MKRVETVLIVVSLLVLGVIGYLLFAGVIVLKPYTFPKVPDVG